MGKVPTIVHISYRIPTLARSAHTFTIALFTPAQFRANLTFSPSVYYLGISLVGWRLFSFKEDSILY